MAAKERPPARYQLDTSKGRTLTFETTLTAKQAFEIVATLKPRTSFHDWILKGSVKATEKQILWALKTAQDHLDSQAIGKGPGPFIELCKKLKKLQEDAGTRVILRFDNLTLKYVDKGDNAGSTHLFKKSLYMGRLTADGHLKADISVKDDLEKIASDPVKAAREYGRKSGSCSYCGKTLRDPVSRFGGIGPICLTKLAGESARDEMERDYRNSLTSNLARKFADFTNVKKNFRED